MLTFNAKLRLPNGRPTVRKVFAKSADDALRKASEMGEVRELSLVVAMMIHSSELSMV